MYVTPYLNFDGNCAEAFRFYADVLGGTIDFLQTYGDSPAAEHVSADSRDRVIHVHMTAGDVELMASDAPAGRFERPQGIYVSLHVEDAAEGERIFRRLEEGGKVNMPFEKTFWAERFGMVVDRFGTPWMVNVTGAQVG